MNIKRFLHRKEQDEFGNMCDVGFLIDILVILISATPTLLLIFLIYLLYKINN